MKTILMLVALVFILPPVSSRSVGTVYFDDSDPEIIVLGNGACYEIGMLKSNGAITYITDKTTGEHITLGSRYEQPGSVIGGNSPARQRPITGCCAHTRFTCRCS